MQDLLVSASGDITNYLPRSSALMDSIGTTMTEPEMQAMARKSGTHVSRLSIIAAKSHPE